MTDYKGLCLYCFKELSDGEICPHCGNNCFDPVGVNHLTPGTTLNGRIVVGRAIGEDETGIVYAAYDTEIGCLLRLREYFPEGIAQRMPDGSVEAQEGMQQEFDAGRADLIERAGGRSAFFEEKGTCYFARKDKKEEESENSTAEAEESAAAPEEPIEGKKVTRQMIILGAVIVVVLIGGVALLLSLMGRNSADTTKQTDITDEPASEWAAPTDAPQTKDTEDPDDREIVDPGTMAWQDEEADEEDGWIVSEEEWEEPYEDEGSFVKPTATPVANYAKATPEQIRELQWRLIELRWLDAKKPTGKYDKATKTAVKDFQKYLNKQFNANLTEDGICGRKTANWLEDEDAPTRPEAPTPKPTEEPIAKPTLTPTEEPTEEPVVQPTLTPTEAPAPEPTQTPVDIDAAYAMLSELGWEDVLSFQQYVNAEVYGQQQVLPETGEMDDDTANFLTGITADNMDVFMRPVPTEEPAPEPTPEPIDYEGAADMLTMLGWEDVFSFQQYAGITESGDMDEDTALFLLNLTDEELMQYAKPEPTPEPIDYEGAADMLAMLGWEDVLSFQQYVNGAVYEQQVLPESGEMDDETAIFLTELTSDNMDVFMRPEPKEEPVPEEEPEAEPEEEPVPDEEPEPEEEPEEPFDPAAYAHDLLISMGWMDETAEEDPLTYDVILAFQQHINATYGEETLPETGELDAETVDFLNGLTDEEIEVLTLEENVEG